MSIAGLRAAQMQGIYGATKAAVISMTQTLAAEFGSSKIQVNATAPGLVETKFASTLVSSPAILERITQRTPFGRHAQPGEMAGGAVSLLSDASSYVAGTVLVQGSRMAVRPRPDVQQRETQAIAVGCRMADPARRPRTLAELYAEPCAS